MSLGAEVTQSHPELVMRNAVESFAVVDKTHVQICLVFSSLFSNPSDVGDVISSSACSLSEASLAIR